MMLDSVTGAETMRIGTVWSLDANQVEVRLDPSVGGLVKASVHGVMPVAAVNSYVCIPVAQYRVVARVDRIRIDQLTSPPDASDPDQLTLRTLECTIVGRIANGRFDSGLTAYPALHSAVLASSERDLDTILSPLDGVSIEVGTAPAAGDRPVRINANRLLARHSLVVGSTGTGKSCTVLGILDSLFESSLPSSNILIFDGNGEYTSALANNSTRKAATNFLALGPELGGDNGLILPHWLMNNDEHLALFRAGEGIQAPLLQRAISDARLASGNRDSERVRLQCVSLVISTMRGILQGGTSRKPQEPLVAQLSSLDTLVASFVGQEGPIHWRQIRTVTSGWQDIGLDAQSWNPPDAVQVNSLSTLLDTIEAHVRSGLNSLGLGSASSDGDFDSPLYYDLQELADKYLPARISLESATDPRVTSYVQGLSMRLSRMLADSRYDFMTRVAYFERSLARLLRLLLGWGPAVLRQGESASPWQEWVVGQQGSGDSRHSVVVLDLSLVAGDVLEDVTALVGRLIMDFTMRLRPRAALPTLLVLEEAHRYVPAETRAGSSRSSLVFERIAKEGRKFGLGLLLATQRPSELSATVASQCGTIISHRLGNFADQELLRFASPYSSRGMLAQLAGLAQQHAVIMGEAVNSPVLVRIRDVPDAPEGRDPDFVGAWASPDVDGGLLIDEVAADWQQEPQPDQSDIGADVLGAAHDSAGAFAFNEDEPPF